MWFKIVNEEGDYRTKDGDAINLLSAELWVATPDGLNIGWVEFESEDVCVRELGLVRI